MYPVLTSLLTKLEAIPDVTSCKIGIEPGMTPDDFPMIRIVPTIVRPGNQVFTRKMEVVVYYGAAVLEFDGMDALYETLFEMEYAIIKAMTSSGSGYGVKFIETFADEDEPGEAYKQFASRFEIEARLDIVY